MTAKELAVKIADGELGRVVATNNKTGEVYINRDLIRAEYDLTISDSRTVKALLERQLSEKELEAAL